MSAAAHAEEADGIRFRSDMTVELIKHAASDADVIWAARVSTKGESSLEELQADPERSRGADPLPHAGPARHAVRALLDDLLRAARRSSCSVSSCGTARSATTRSPAATASCEPVFYVPAPEPQAGPGGQARQVRVRRRAPTSSTRSSSRRPSAAAARRTRRTCEMLEAGVAREVARGVLPVDLYSSMYATCNARALMNFLSLRTQPRGLGVPLLPAAGDRDGRRADGGAVGAAHAAHLRGVPGGGRVAP